ncbi:MAG: SDR family NAD(P)-dependent oxidoreductase [Myxococcota bacterium]
MTRRSGLETREVVILGGGFSGLGVALRLRSRGIEDFVILEKASQLGGTWRDNTYPGCACDVPSQLYSFSEGPHPKWSRVFAEQPEIQRYLLDVAATRGLQPHVRVDTEVLHMQWDEADQRWHIETSRGDIRARFVVAGAGPLHEPRTPPIPGLETFQGTTFHSARWRHDHDLTGRRVAVVGTGSSAIQFVPKIQPQVESLVLFQRTAPWVLPKLDHRYPAIETAAFQYLPGFRRAYRGLLYAGLEALQLAQRKPAVMRVLQRIAARHLQRSVPDAALRDKLTPGYTMGCKRLLLSNTYYPALCQPNASVVHGGLTRVTADGVVGADGVEHAVDTIVFATGFEVTDPPIAGRIADASGATLAEHWQGSPRAYLGTTVHGFPNLFFMIGPNLGNGHSSAFVLIEAQAAYITDAIETLARRGATSFDVRHDVQSRYNDEVQAALAGTVWNAGGCSSYYLDRNGTNSTIYPWTTLDLRRRLRRFDVDCFELSGVEPGRVATEPIVLPGSVVAITGGAHGIGLATAKRFAAAGARVCIGDVDIEAARAEAAKLGIMALPLDVSDRGSFSAFVDAVREGLGPIDVLVNNAGVMPTGPFLDEPDSVDAAAMSVNHWGTSLGMKLVLPRMIASGRGHVVNVASMAGKVHVAGLATYVASKHATVGLTRAVREEIDGTGVTLTTILPGPVKTRLSDGIPLSGIHPIAPDKIAQAIVRSCTTRAPEIAVPGLLGLLPVAHMMLPTAWMAAFRRAIRSDRVLTSSDAAVRGSYEASIRAQGDRHLGARATNAPTVQLR